MDMSSTTSMTMSTMTMSNMPSSTTASSMQNMQGMDMSTMTMPASQMSMTFFTSTTTPLLSSSWTPTSTSTYAGTCIFLIILSLILRVLYALKAVLERKWLHDSLQRRYVRVADAGIAEAGEGKAGITGVLTTNGVDEKVRLVQPVDALGGGPWSRPWRLSVDLPRALLVTVMVGVGYLLMLAVMTMNVGYFLSVLAGAFVGELFFGRYSTHVEDHH